MHYFPHFYLLLGNNEAISFFYSHMLKYETLFEGFSRAKVSYFGENFFVRRFYGQV